MREHAAEGNHHHIISLSLPPPLPLSLSPSLPLCLASSLPLSLSPSLPPSFTPSLSLSPPSPPPPLTLCEVAAEGVQRRARLHRLIQGSGIRG